MIMTCLSEPVSKAMTPGRGKGKGLGVLAIHLPLKPTPVAPSLVRRTSLLALFFVLRALHPLCNSVLSHGQPWRETSNPHFHPPQSLGPPATTWARGAALLVPTSALRSRARPQHHYLIIKSLFFFFPLNWKDSAINKGFC